MTAPVLQPNDDALARAVETLRGGGLVAMPTETVYGLACDASNGEAIARLYAAKGRPSFNPLIAHVAAGDMAAREGLWDESSSALVDHDTNESSSRRVGRSTFATSSSKEAAECGTPWGAV